MGTKSWVLCSVLHVWILLPFPFAAAVFPPVRLTVSSHYVVLGNGIVNLDLTNPEGNVAGVHYNGVSNLLEHQYHSSKRGYWDMSWDDSTGRTAVDDWIETGVCNASLDDSIIEGVTADDGWQIRGSKFMVVVNNDNMVEVSFKMEWNPSTGRGRPALNVDKRYIMLRGSSGFYAYSIYEHKNGWPNLNIHETRLAFKLDKARFRYMAISDSRQRMMPLPEDRLRGRAQMLAYKEAVRMINPTNPSFKGEVDDKYQYSIENQYNKVHGWIGSDPPIGFWIITPSNEFKMGGPTKQDLTSHTGPVALSMFVSAHYQGHAVGVRLVNGEYWKKVFGPVYIYLNSNPGKVDIPRLWSDAKSQVEREVNFWPYGFAASEDFPKAHIRGAISGRLHVRDRFVSAVDMPANTAYVGLAPVGDLGSWQSESKGYQFWTRTDTGGLFAIRNVRAGFYSLYAWVPGFIGEFRYATNIVIAEGKEINLGNVVFEPPRIGPTLWEIGIPDRSATEFYVPDPNPQYVNKLYVNHPEKFRQYGLWDRYSELYPKGDLVYIVGVSDWRRDWFYAHVTRKTGNARKPYIATTWQIRFRLNKIIPNTIYTLRISIASASNPALQVRFNNPKLPIPHHEIKVRAGNNAIARHGIKGMHWLFSIDVKSSWLVQGDNVIFLTQRIATGPFEGLMYDYVRLEGPK